MVSHEHHALDFALHVDADARVGSAVTDAVVLDAIAMRRERLAALRAKENAHLAAGDDIVVADKVVRVAVADRHAMRSVATNTIPLRDTRTHAPAEEDANVVVFDPVF